MYVKHTSVYELTAPIMEQKACQTDEKETLAMSQGKCRYCMKKILWFIAMTLDVHYLLYTFLQYCLILQLIY